MAHEHMDEKAAQFMRQSKTGEYLLSLRNNKGLSLAQVSKLLEISANYLSEIERGVKVPSDHLLQQLAEYYKVSEDDLFERYGKIPMSVREALASNKILRRAIAEINSDKRLSEEKKSAIFSELYSLYKNSLSELS